MGVQQVVGIYLAAGKSLRMGKNKLNLPFGDVYLGSSAFQSALDSELTWTIAVTRKGERHLWLDPFSQRNGWSMFQSRDAAEGQSASLKAGVKAAVEMGAKAIVVLLADQPFVTSTNINQLLCNYRAPFVAASKNGFPMPPIVFSQDLFPALLKLTGDAGARTLLQTAREKGILVEFPDHVFIDVDTQEDYLNLLNDGRDKFGCHRKERDTQRGIRKSDGQGCLYQ